MPQEQAPHRPSPEATQAAHYLATITAHFLEFGPLWEKTPADLVYELDYHNAWQQYEVDQERKRSEPAGTYHEVRLVDLRALAQANSGSSPQILIGLHFLTFAHLMRRHVVEAVPLSA